MSSIFPLFFSLLFIASCGKHEQSSFGRQGVQDISRVTNPDALSQDVMDEELESLEKFLRAGGSPEFELSNGRTLLTEACFWAKFKVLDLLLKYKADINHRDRSGKSAADYGEGDIKIKRSLYPELIIELKKALFVQALANDLTALKKTLAENPPINFFILESELGPQATSREGETFLTFCIKENLQNVLRFLAQPKLELDVNMKNKEGESPLKIAQNLNNKNIEKLLKKLGATE
jgi:ankyrin repeat protein